MNFLIEIVTQVEPTESSTLEPTRSTEPTPPEPTPPSRGDEEPGSNFSKFHRNRFVTKIIITIKKTTKIEKLVFL